MMTPAGALDGEELLVIELLESGRLRQEPSITRNCYTSSSIWKS